MWNVRATQDFWKTVDALKPKYTRAEFIEIVRTVREAILELQEDGHVTLIGWDEHVLSSPPFDDGSHFVFHIHDDDVLVVYFKRFGRHTIRMVGVYSHQTIPGGR